MAITDRLPNSPSAKPLRTRSCVAKMPPPSLATLSTRTSTGNGSVASKSTSASTRSSNVRRRLAFSKPLTADKQLYIPRASLWSEGVAAQSAQTGSALFVINHMEAVRATQDRKWHGGITEVIVSEVDTVAKKVGKILALIRNEKNKFVVYAYFPAYSDQPVSFVDSEFYQGNMFRQGDMIMSKKRCSFVAVLGLTDCGQDIMRKVLEATPTSQGLNPMRRKEWMLDLRDPTTKETQIAREVEVEAVTIRSGQNMLVAVALVYASETMMSA